MELRQSHQDPSGQRKGKEERCLGWRMAGFPASPTQRLGTVVHVKRTSPATNQMSCTYATPQVVEHNMTQNMSLG